MRNVKRSYIGNVTNYLILADPQRPWRKDCIVIFQVRKYGGNR